MVAEGGVVELGRVERRDHLTATVIFGQHTRAEDIARQDENDRSLVVQSVTHRRHPGQATPSVPDGVRRIDIVDEQKSDRVEWNGRRRAARARAKAKE